MGYWMLVWLLASSSSRKLIFQGERGKGKGAATAVGSLEVVNIR